TLETSCSLSGSARSEATPEVKHPGVNGVVLFVDHLQFRGRLVERDAGRKAPKSAQQRAGLIDISRRLREPDVGFGEGELEVGWQNADDGVRQSSDVDGLPHDLRVA